MTDKHIPASKLLALITFNAVHLDNEPEYVKADTLRALIDEAPEVEPMAKVLCIIDEDDELQPYAFYSNDEAPRQEELKNKFVIFDVWLSPPPSPDLTKLVGELVEALEDANKKIRKAKDFEYESQEHISESAYELNGFLGSTAADISVNWQKTIDSNNELLTRAKEYLK